MKLTRTFRSSSLICGSGSGVSKASGRRTLPHFDRVDGSETGEKSEIWAGARRTFCSRRSSGVSRAPGNKSGTTHHPSALPKPITHAQIATDLLPLHPVLGQRHCIRSLQCAISRPVTGILKRLLSMIYRVILRPDFNRNANPCRQPHPYPWSKENDQRLATKTYCKPFCVNLYAVFTFSALK
jgi:hypothetical protein